MLLYQFKKGTNPRRVMIYLAEKNIEIPRYELDYANREHRSAKYLAINPAGRAPALVIDDGSAIRESAAIVEYLEELYPDIPLIGEDAVTRARVRSLERVGNDLIVRCQAWLWNITDAFKAKEPDPSQYVAERVYRYVSELLDILETEIGENEFLAGDRLSIADCTTFAIFQTARERFNLPLGSDHPKLDAWYARFRARPSADY